MHVVVVGAGVSGLSCAIRLVEHGHRVQVVSEARTPLVTSDRSAAAFTPFRAAGGGRFERWTRGSFEAFCEIERRHGQEAGVRTSTMTEYYFEPFEGAPWWLGAIGEGEVLRTGIPERYGYAVRVRVPQIDMRVYMPWLERRFIEGGGRFKHAHVADIDQAFESGADVVVNTSALGARELARDARMTPIRGQIVCAPNDIALDECYADSGQAGESTYLFPYHDRIVLGGTYEKGVEAAVTDERALERLVERCRTLLRETGHPRWADLARTRLSTWAGLRPARVDGTNNADIRLEREVLPGGRIVVHDYGHAGVGVTLSWGCAGEVSDLVGTFG